MWGFIKKRKKRRVSSVTKHYAEHKEQARTLIVGRIEYYNQFYNFKYNRVAIRNQRRCWGSCSSLKNLNFNYKIVLLPDHLQDYIVVHELCHLAELNHGKHFWALVAQQMPQYPTYIAQLQSIDTLGGSVAMLEKVRPLYSKTTLEDVTRLTPTLEGTCC
jgi:predicted metal-dependent hydrolase